MFVRNDLDRKSEYPARCQHARHLRKNFREIADVNEDVGRQDHVEILCRRRLHVIGDVHFTQCIVDAKGGGPREHRRRQIDAGEQR